MGSGDITGATARSTSRVVMLGLAMGYAAIAAGNQMITVFLIRFLTDDLSIAPAIAAAMFAAVKLYDGFVDPIVGYTSDRTESRWGRRRPYLLASAILTPIALLGVFAMPDIASPTWRIIYLMAMLALHGTAYSLYVVPASAMIVEATDDYHARSTILAWRTYGGFAGQLLGSTVPSWILASIGGDRSGHANMVMVVAAIVLALGIVSVPMLRQVRGTKRIASSEDGFLRQLLMAWRSKPFRTMIIVHIVFMMGTATVMSSNALFTRYVLQRTDAWLGSFYIFMTLGNVLAVPLWLRLSKRLDKKTTYILALSTYGLGVLSWTLAGPGDSLFILSLRVFLIGAVMAGVVLMAGSMLTDAVRYDYVQSGKRREGAFTGFMSLVDKTSSAAGLTGMGLVLSAMGYASSGGTAPKAQSAETIWAITISFSVFPALMAFLAIFLLRGYNIREADLRDPSDVAADIEENVLAHATAPIGNVAPQLA
jgi:GPH family glycoside/pentoside/hexuronide:cation symporter